MARHPVGRKHLTLLLCCHRNIQGDGAAAARRWLPLLHYPLPFTVVPPTVAAHGIAAWLQPVVADSPDGSPCHRKLQPALCTHHSTNCPSPDHHQHPYPHQGVPCAHQRRLYWRRIHRCRAHGHSAHTGAQRHRRPPPRTSRPAVQILAAATGYAYGSKACRVPASAPPTGAASTCAAYRHRAHTGPQRHWRPPPRTSRQPPSPGL